MRLHFVVCLVCLIACGGTESTPEPSPTEPAPRVESEPAEEPKEKAKKVKEPRERVALPEALPVEGYPKVAIVGFGVRLELNPPFQAAIIPHGEEEKNRLVASWWDLTAKGAGQNGMAGLHNTVVLPGEWVADATPTPGADDKTGAPIISVGGTQIRLPAGAKSMGGAMNVMVGPADSVWRVAVNDAEPVAWPDNHMLHSEDPASGSAIAFKARPSKPFGPWDQANLP